MLYKRGRYYWTRFKWQGKIIDKSSRATDKKTARNIEAKIRSELAQENFGILQPKEVPTLGKFLGFFGDWAPKKWPLMGQPNSGAWSQKFSLNERTCWGSLRNHDQPNKHAVPRPGEGKL